MMRNIGVLRTGVLLLACLFATVGVAAPLASDHTILYYLIEMQRRSGTGCNGEAVTPLPSLVPSEGLRRLAGDLAAERSGSLAEVLAANGLAGTSVFMGRAGDGSPQQVHEQLKGQYCASLTNPAYIYIGAAKEQGVWVVLMSGQQPGARDTTSTPNAGRNGGGYQGSGSSAGADGSGGSYQGNTGAMDSPTGAASSGTAAVASEYQAPEPPPEYLQPRPGITPLHDSDPPRPVEILPSDRLPQQGGASDESSVSPDGGVGYPVPAGNAPTGRSGYEIQGGNSPGGASSQYPVTYPSYGGAPGNTGAPSPYTDGSSGNGASPNDPDPLPDIGHKIQLTVPGGDASRPAGSSSEGSGGATKSRKGMRTVQ